MQLSRANQVFSGILDNLFQNLKDLHLTLGNNLQHDALGEFLQSLPSLEKLGLSRAPAPTKDLITLRNYILSAANLLEVQLDFCEEAAHSDLFGLFVALSTKSELT